MAQNWHFWSIWARPCRLIQCPVGGSVGGCGARAVSRKTPIYFITYFLVKFGWLSEQTMGEEPALNKSESPTSLLTGAGAFLTSVFKLHLRKYDVKLKF